jgi:hypothetical protein
MDINTKIFGAIKRLLGFYKSIAFEQALRLGLGERCLRDFARTYMLSIFLDYGKALDSLSLLSQISQSELAGKGPASWRHLFFGLL